MRRIAITIAFLIGLILIAACATGTGTGQSSAQPATVLFVCEHGNVKSLMAMSYFNQLAHERGLPLVAISRGTALDSDTVPKAIADGLRADGLDVSRFRPTKVTNSDLNSARRVIAIGVALPADMPTPVGRIERWDDVPPASVDFEVSSQAIRTRVQALLDEFAPD